MAVLVVLTALFAPSVDAVDVEKKVRLSLQLGFHDTADDVPSNAANQQIILRTDRSFLNVLRDPRDDSAALGSLQIKSSPRIVASVQYAPTKMFVIEGSVGYQRGDVGDIEIQAQYPNSFNPDEIPYFFQTFKVPAGELEQIPIQLTGLARFRPRSNFNPFVGAGIGYTVVGYSISEELNTLSVRMDQSRGQFNSVRDNIGTFVPEGPVRDLRGAEIIAPDYFQWHAVVGAEYSFNRKWAMYGDVRYTFAQTEFEVRFDGAETLGVAVPNNVVFVDEIAANPDRYGPMNVIDGGLIDAGRFAPRAGAPANTDCTTNPGQCEFVFEPDGEVDPGLYYVDGGKIKYGGWSFALGVRYTF